MSNKEYGIFKSVSFLNEDMQIKIYNNEKGYALKLSKDEFKNLKDICDKIKSELKTLSDKFNGYKKYYDIKPLSIFHTSTDFYYASYSLYDFKDINQYYHSNMTEKEIDEQLEKDMKEYLQDIHKIYKPLLKKYGFELEDTSDHAIQYYNNKYSIGVEFIFLNYEYVSVHMFHKSIIIEK